MASAHRKRNSQTKRHRQESRGRQVQPSPGNSTEASPSPASSVIERFFWLFLGGIFLIGLIVRIFALIEFTNENPFALTLISDAKVYWEWAGRIAAGVLIDDKPFLSAPLYPYVLGLIRVTGGGLLTVFVLQLILHLVTAGGIGLIGRARFGPTVGLLAAGLFLLLNEPVFNATRLLPGTVQLSLIVTLWATVLRAQQRCSWVWYAVAGLLLGLTCLANPPMMLLLVLLGVWVVWDADQRAVGLRHAAALVAVALTVLSAATVHNALACDEFIPMTAHAGITFHQGNAPGADGTYTEIPGISKKRDQMHADAIRVYQEATGGSASWRGADRYFLAQGLQYWRSRPTAAVTLAVRKLYSFLSFRHYGDVYLSTAEVECGLSDWLRLAPVPIPWLMGPALVGLVLMLRRPLRYGPEGMFFAVPLLVVVVFWYSPRYRLPAVPVIVVASAFAIQTVVRWRTNRLPASITVVSVGLSLLLGPINRAIGEDPLLPHVAGVHFQLANALTRQGKVDETVGHIRAGMRIHPKHPEAPKSHYNVANALAGEGKLDEAVEYYSQALELNPDYVEAHVNLGSVLRRQGKVDEAVDHLRSALRINPGFAAAHYNLGNIWARRGEFDEAIASYEQALHYAPDYVKAYLNLGAALTRQNRIDEAIEALRKAVKADPDSVQARFNLGASLSRNGQSEEAIREFRETLRLDPTHAAASRQLEAELARVSDR